MIGLFWNNIRVGRWELACGFLPILREESQKNYVSLLIAIALQPEKYWLVVDGLISKSRGESQKMLGKFMVSRRVLKLIFRYIKII